MNLDNIPKVQGIYCIYNDCTGKCYIGSATNVRKRLNEHRRRLNKGCHHSPHLQAAWNSYGKSAFTPIIVELVLDKDNLVKTEQRWIDRFLAADREYGYNVCPDAGFRRGPAVSEATRKRISELKRGNTYRRGAVVPQEMRDRIAAKLRGRKQSPEVIERAAATRRGKPRSEECKRKLSIIHKGRIISEEQRHKLSIALKGRNVRAEYAQRMRAA